MSILGTTININVNTGNGTSAPELTQAQVEDATSEVFGVVSGERLSQAVAAHGGGGTPTPERMLLATMPVPSGAYMSYGSPNFVHNFLANWAIEMGVTDFTLMDIPISTFYGVAAAVTNGALITPALRITDAQTGWLFELHNGDILVGEAIIPFSGIDTPPTLTAIDNADLGLLIWDIPTRLIESLTTTGFAVTPQRDFTIVDADDYTIKLYIQE